MEKTEFKAPEEAQVLNGWVYEDAIAKKGMEAKVFRKGPCIALVGREPRDNGKYRWHMSLSTKTRIPNWDEIKDARYGLLPPDLTFAQILPPIEEWINIHPHCLHFWEVDDPQW